MRSQPRLESVSETHCVVWPAISGGPEDVPPDSIAAYSIPTAVLPAIVELATRKTYKDLLEAAQKDLHEPYLGAVSAWLSYRLEMYEHKLWQADRKGV